MWIETLDKSAGLVNSDYVKRIYVSEHYSVAEHKQDGWCIRAVMVDGTECEIARSAGHSDLDADYERVLEFYIKLLQDLKPVVYARLMETTSAAKLFKEESSRERALIKKISSNREEGFALLNVK